MCPRKGSIAAVHRSIFLDNTRFREDSMSNIQSGRRSGGVGVSAGASTGGVSVSDGKDAGSGSAPALAPGQEASAVLLHATVSVLAMLWGARALWHHPWTCATLGGAAYGLSHFPHHMTALVLLTFIPATLWMLASHFWSALFLYAASLTVYAFADEGDKARLCASGSRLGASLSRVMQGEWTVLQKEIQAVPAVQSLPAVLSSTVKSLGDEATGLAERAYGAKLPAARAALGLGGGEAGSGSGRGPIGYEAGQSTSELSTASGAGSGSGSGMVGGGGAGESEAQVSALTRGALAEARLASLRAKSEHELDRQAEQQEEQKEQKEEAIPEAIEGESERSIPGTGPLIGSGSGGMVGSDFTAAGAAAPMEDSSAGPVVTVPSTGSSSAPASALSGYAEVLEERHTPDGMEGEGQASSAAGGGGGQPGYGMPPAALAATAQPQLP